MSEEATLAERILDAAEVVLRRHGADKTNVVDIAKVLEMSHSNVYRHFPSKKAILDAVAARWLHKVMTPLDAIAGDHKRPPAKRLLAWFDALCAAKRRKVLDDPELFHVYHGIAIKMQGAVDEHVAGLVGQLEQIIADGIASGDFSSRLIPRAAALAFLQATASFHHPALIIQRQPTEAEGRAVFDLLLAGLRAG